MPEAEHALQHRADDEAAARRRRPGDPIPQPRAPITQGSKRCSCRHDDAGPLTMTSSKPATPPSWPSRTCSCRATQRSFAGPTPTLKMATSPSASRRRGSMTSTSSHGGVSRSKAPGAAWYEKRSAALPSTSVTRSKVGIVVVSAVVAARAAGS
jgi:hypothetical protein